MIINGNKFVKVPHLFVPGDGCYYESKEVAFKQGISPNGTGLWLKTIEFNDRTYYQAGNFNQFN